MVMNVIIFLRDSIRRCSTLIDFLRDSQLAVQFILLYALEHIHSL